MANKGINKVNVKSLGFEYYEVHGANLSPRQPPETTKILEPGIYDIKNDDRNNLYFCPQSAITDDLVDLPNTVSERIIKEVRQFWSGETRAKFDRYNLIYKRGILLHGKQGTGKTCTIVRVMQEHIKDGGIVIFNPHPLHLYHGMMQVREIQPNMRSLVVFEEFENRCHDSNFKSLLDGEIQIDNVVYLATTNYIDRVPNTFKNRPSRFATVLEQGMPDDDARLTYLKSKLAQDDQVDLDGWVSITKGMVIDQLKDMIVSVCCFGLTLQEAAAKINTMEKVEVDEDGEEHLVSVPTVSFKLGGN